MGNFHKLLFIFIIFSVLAGCSSGLAASETTPTLSAAWATVIAEKETDTTAQATQDVAVPSPAIPRLREVTLPAVVASPIVYPPNANPLTGLLVDDPAVLEHRPVVVKVSNSPALVRPQAGLSEADHVYEHYTEVGITRFSAIFYSQTPQRVGSIRSARLIDTFELVAMYKGLLAFAGASIGVDKTIYGSEAVREQLCQFREDQEQCFAEADIHAPGADILPAEFVDRAYKGVLVGAPYYFRDEGIPIPHNLFVNIAALRDLAANRGQAQHPNLNGLVFQENVPTDGEPANVLEVRYRTTLARWEYHHDSGRYLRWADGQQHFDASTEHQLSAANVVVLFAEHERTDIVESQWQDNINWSTRIHLQGRGDAILLRDGQRYDGYWIRSLPSDMLRLITSDGDVLFLKPGNTWFQVMPLPEQLNPETEWVRTG